jgi:hypothetical protein
VRHFVAPVLRRNAALQVPPGYGTRCMTPFHVLVHGGHAKVSGASDQTWTTAMSPAPEGSDLDRCVRRTDPNCIPTLRADIAPVVERRLATMPGSVRTSASKRS